MSQLFATYSITDEDSPGASPRVHVCLFSNEENRREYIKHWLEMREGDGDRATEVFSPTLGSELIAHVYGHGDYSYTLETGMIAIDPQEFSW